ncbi:MAG: HAMP domain-containing sensor histidine kinase [Prochlorococcaceae cyanobacterium]
MRRRPPTARPARSLRRQQIELLLLYLGSLAGVLVLFAAVVREGFQARQLEDVRSHLSLIAEDFSGLPLPLPGTERNLQESRKDFATARQQVEWFVAGRPGPVARLGEMHTLGPLPRKLEGQRVTWQEGSDWIALVRPSDRAPGVWIRVSEDVEPLENRRRQLDLTLAIAIALALLLSAASALMLTRRAVAPLERSLNRLRQFSLDASHELRGPLAALAANAEMGLLEESREGASQHRRFEAIASATAQMGRLVDDLLLLARQDEERLEASQQVDFSALLEQQITLHRDGLDLKHQQLKLDLTPGLQVQGQLALLQRLVRNLLDNAMRYTPEGGLVTVRSHRRGSSVVLSVEDSGIGLSEEELPQVFDRFWRARSDRPDGGSGLGLAIVSRICSSHGGDIRVTSQSGQGSCFTVELPSSS